MRQWARSEARRRPELVRAGYFGSYARGEWGVGSDLDVVLIVTRAARPWPERGRDWRSERLPVPADVLVYTEAEWERLQAQGGRFARVLAEETVWVHPEV